MNNSSEAQQDVDSCAKGTDSAANVATVNKIPHRYCKEFSWTGHVCSRAEIAFKCAQRNFLDQDLKKQKQKQTK